MQRPSLRPMALLVVLALSMSGGLVAEAADTNTRISCPPDIPRAGFSDVYPLSPHAYDIDCLAWRGIVPDDSAFAPSDLLTRWEMAVWLDAALRWVQDRYGSVASPFSDTAGLAASESIGAVGQIDVTRGVGDGRFDPFGAVPRWQMALFLTRTFEASGNGLPPAADRGFNDIGGATAEAQTAINQLAALGITQGTGPGTFSPDQPVTREQMASFVARLLEQVWVLQPTATTCNTSVLPIECAGSMIAPAPAVDLRVRVPMFMAAHVGDLDLAQELFESPGTRIDLFVNGSPIEVTSSLHRHSGAVYRYWEGTIAAGTTGTLTVTSHSHLRGVLTTVREVTIDFR